MDAWPGNYDAAKMIFEFFGIQYTARKHGTMTIFEGLYAEKLLWAVTLEGKGKADFGVQFRRSDTGRDLGGALLHSCYGIECKSEGKASLNPDGGTVEYKYVRITSRGGEVVISQDGIHATIN